MNKFKQHLSYWQRGYKTNLVRYSLATSKIGHEYINIYVHNENNV